MANAIQLGDLRTRIRDRFELYSDQVADSVLTTWINEANQKLAGILLKFNDNWSLSEDTQNIVAGTKSYSLPADCWRVLRVDVKDSSDQFITMEPYAISEETALDYNNVVGVGQYRYLVSGSNIRMSPLPTYSITNGLRVLYNANPALLVDDTDTLDGVSGFENYIILECGIKANQRFATDDYQSLIVERSDMEKFIKSLANSKDTGNPSRVRDAYEEFHGRWWIPARGLR